MPKFKYFGNFYVLFWPKWVNKIILRVAKLKRYRSLRSGKHIFWHKAIKDGEFKDVPKKFVDAVSFSNQYYRLTKRHDEPAATSKQNKLRQKLFSRIRKKRDRIYRRAGESKRHYMARLSRHKTETCNSFLLNKAGFK